MKVKAVYRDIKDQRETDFKAKVIEWDASDELPWPEVEGMVRAAAPEGYELVQVEKV